MAKKSFSLKREYKESWKYIKSSKNIVYSIIGLFVLFFLIGVFVPAPEIISERIQDFMKNLVQQTKGMSQGELIWFIFSNNLQSSFLGTLFGIFLGIFPILSTISNGYVVGFVAKMSIESSGVLSLWKLLPHGIFELPAIFLSFSMGVRLGLSLFSKKKWGKTKENITSSAKTFLLVVVPLLVVAAVIEGTLIFFGTN